MIGKLSAPRFDETYIGGEEPDLQEGVVMIGKLLGPEVRLRSS